MRRSGLVAALVAGLAAAACGPDQELYTFELASDEPPLDVSVREVEREPDRSELEVRPYDRDRRLDFLAADCAMDELARRRGFERYVVDRGLLDELVGPRRGKARIAIERVTPDAHLLTHEVRGEKITSRVKPGLFLGPQLVREGPVWACTVFHEPLLARRGARRDPTAFYEVARLPLDDLGQARTEHGLPVELDRAVSADGKGSLRLAADGHSQASLAYIWGEYLPYDNASITLQAKLLTRDFDGDAELAIRPSYREGDDESPVSDPGAPADRTAGWQERELVLFLEPGQRLRELQIELQLVGTGTVWVDDLRLVKGPGWTYWRALKQ